MSDADRLPASGNAGGSGFADSVKFERIYYKTCPLCGSADIASFRKVDCSRHPLYQPGFFRGMFWCRCAGCAHVFTSGYFGPEAAGKLFEKTNDGQRLGHDFERQRAVSARMVSRVQTYGQPAGAWLDVGFGNGSLLFTAAEFGYEVVGTEMRADSVEMLNRLGYEAHRIDIGVESGWSKLIVAAHAPRFAVISIADVLEHMPFPLLALRAAYELMAPGGTLLVSMPAYDSPAWQFLDGTIGVHNPYWAEIEHYHNFSRARLYALLAQCGFANFSYGISERYRACMEVLARKVGA